MLSLIILSVVAGIAAGLLGWIPPSLRPHLDHFITLGLCLLVFAIGVGIGRSRDVWRRLREAGFRVLLVPAGTIVGTLLGSLLVPLLMAVTVREALAVGAGFGWYSLSGVLLTRLHSPELGAVAFLCNVFREMLTILLIPLLARYAGTYTVIAPGGATTMDTTLPLISRYADQHVVLLAFINGLVLSSLVPVLVPLMIG